MSKFQYFCLQHFNWRKENDIDTILDEDWSAYERDYKFWTEGRDKEGKPREYFQSCCNGLNYIRSDSMSLH